MAGHPHSKPGPFARITPFLRPLIIWALPWGALAYVAAEGSPHLTRDLVGVALMVSINLYYLFEVLLTKKSAKIPRSLIFLGFALTFAALVGAYACADLVAAHRYAGCYIETVQPHPHWSPGSLDAVYYALSTLTTAGFGDITAHTRACRALTVAELGVGFPALGLSIAGVAARVFSDLQGDKTPVIPAAPAATNAPAPATKTTAPATNAAPPPAGTSPTSTTAQPSATNAAPLPPTLHAPPPLPQPPQPTPHQHGAARDEQGPATS